MRSRKGISPILATLLLIVIAVAAVIVTYAWVLTFTGSQTQQAGAVLTVVNTRFYNDTGTLKIEHTIRNSGSADAKIVEVYIGTSSTSLAMLTSGVEYNPTNQVVQAEEAIIITITYSWSSGTRYYFKVVTEAGQVLPFNAKP